MKVEDLKREFERKYPGVFNTYPVNRIRTGIFVMDLLTGGGIPESRITIFWGNKSSGKTSISLKVAKQFMKCKPDKKVLYLDFEHSYTEEWAKNFLGEDIERLIYVAPTYGEEGIDILAALCEADDVVLAIVDSVAMMIPQAEAEASSLDDFMCKHPRLVNKMFRKVVPIMAQSRTGRNLTLLLINQPVYDIGKRSFQPLMKKPGGIRQDMLASLDIRFYSNVYKKVGGVAVSTTIPFSIEKNKVGIPKGRGEFTMYIAPYQNYKIGDIDELKTILVYAKRAGILERKGNKWVYNNTTLNSIEDIDREELKEILLNKLLCNSSLLVADDKEEEEKDNED